MTDTKKTLTVLGCGFMGTALLGGIIMTTSPGESRVKQYIAAVQRQESASRLEAQFSDHREYVEVVCKDNVRALSQADVVVLGFQPGDVKSVLGESGVSNALQGKLIISMLAGVSCDTIRDVLMSSRADDETQREHLRVVRVVPSIGAQISESASLVSASTLDETDIDFVNWFFGRVGTAETVAEELLDAAVGLSATSHALVVTAIDSLVDGSVSRGIPRSTARKIAAQCFRGASSLLLEKMTLEELKDSMSVPRGITTEAWIHLDETNTRRAVSQTVRKAIDYAENMS